MSKLQKVLCFEFFFKDYMLRVTLDEAKFAKFGSSVSRCTQETLKA